MLLQGRNQTKGEQSMIIKNKPGELEGTLNLYRQDTQEARAHHCLNKPHAFHPEQQNLLLV